MSEAPVHSSPSLPGGGVGAAGEERVTTGLSSSPLYYKVLMKELRERARECDALSNFLDEFAAVEETFGKSFVKTGSVCLSSCRSDWPIGTNAAWNNTCVYVEKAGKQHIGYALCLSQSVSRSFNDSAREYHTVLQSIDNRMQTLFDELLKTKRTYERNLSKYSRLVLETEANIRSKDALLQEAATRGNQKEVDDEGFLNRSLIKMKGSMQVMGKFAPGDVLRKLDERCRLQLQEIDSNEESLAASVKIYNEIRHDFIVELSNSNHKLEQLESVRLQLFIDGLSRFCLACQGMMDHLESLISEQIGQFAFLDHERELEALHLDKSDHSSEFAGTKLPEPDQLGQYLATVSKIIDAMETLRGLVQRSTVTMVEIAESGKYYAKVCNRIVDKQHGVVVKSNALSDTAAMLRGGSGAQVPPFGVLLSAIEAPLTKKGWDAAISAVSKFAEAMQTSSEVIVEKCCVNADTLMRRVESSRKELNDIVSMNTKRVDALQTNATRATAKLKKVRVELKDLRENSAVVASKQQPHMPSLSLSENVEAKPSEDTSSPLSSPRESEHLDVSSVTSGESAVSSSAEGATVATAATPTEPQQAESQLSSPPLKRGSTVRLPSIPFQSLDPLKIGSALGAAVGLESASDRKVNRIAYLEEEEKTLIDAETMAILALSNAKESCMTELASAIENAKQSLSRDLLNIKMILQILMDCQRLSQEICQSAVLKIRNASDAVDRQADFEYFINFVRNTTVGITNGVSTYTIDNGATGGTKSSFATYEVPVEEGFIPIQNPVISHERELRALAKTQAAENQNPPSGDERSKTGDKAAEDSDDETVEEVERVASSDSHDISLSSPVIAPAEESEKEPPKITLPPPVASKAPVEALMSPQKMAINARISEVMSNYNTATSPSIIQTPSSESEAVAQVEKQEEEVVEIPKPLSLPEAAVEPKISTSGSVVTSTPPADVAPSSPDQLKYTPSQFPREEAYVPPPDSTTGETEKVIESFSCAIYPKRGMLTHGRLYVFGKYLLFSGWPECKINIPLHTISSIERTNSLVIIPNALLITVQSGEEYFFGSFIERELCYNLLKSLVEVSKCLAELSDPNATTSAAEKDSPDVRKSLSRKNLSENEAALKNTVNSLSNLIDALEKSGDADDSTAEAGGAASVDVGYISSEAEDFTAASGPIDFDKLFKSNSNIVPLHSQDISFKPTDVWKYYWQKSDGFRDFLTAQGDLEINAAEWVPVAEQPAEDVLKMKFSYTRTVSYLHPRTDSMVGFMGPKNATAVMQQFLYVPEKASGNALSKKFKKGMILMVTQFQGIPMADVFKVLQYWTFEPAGTDGQCTVRMALAIHYCKSTMLKGSILSGSRDELIILTKEWCNYISSKLTTAIAAKLSSRKASSRVPSGAKAAAREGAPALADASAVELKAVTDALAKQLADVSKKLDKMVMAVDSMEADRKKSNLIIYSLTAFIFVLMYAVFRR